MMYKIAFSLLATIIPSMFFAEEKNHLEKKHIQRVIQVGNITENTYKVFIKDEHHKYHEPITLYPGCTQFMFCRTEKISMISFQPCKPAGKMFQIHKPLSEMNRADCYDESALESNFHFYLLPDHSIKSFPAASQQDLEIVEQVKNHTFVAPSRPFTTPFAKKS